MTRDILAFDVGTTAFKLAVFSPELEKRCEARRAYAVNIYGDGCADIDPQVWWEALRDCCAELKHELANVGVVSLSVTTPGLTPMDADGRALGPGILFFDGRSTRRPAPSARASARSSSSAKPATCPSAAALRSLDPLDPRQPARCLARHGEVRPHEHVPREAPDRALGDRSVHRVHHRPLQHRGRRPDLDDPFSTPPKSPKTGCRRSCARSVVGAILPAVADELGLPADAVVLCGGNDAVLAAYSAGLDRPGQIGPSAEPAKSP